MAADLINLGTVDAVLVDMGATVSRQEQCGRALRALAALTATPPASAPGLPAFVARDDLAALLGVLADQALQLTAEARDTLRDGRRMMLA